MMKRLMLLALLLAGCTASPGVARSPAASAATAASATPTAGMSTTQPTAPPPATAVTSTVYTPEDVEIARLISAGADEAIPQLRLLNDMDPDQLEDQFLPLGLWITSQKAGVEALTPSNCTTAAVALFMEGIDRYDAIRIQFLAWRDWGANGHAFPAGAPREARETLEAALVELEAHCPGRAALAAHEHDLP